jgi:C-terminal processing protease CtpA/Prc
MSGQQDRMVIVQKIEELIAEKLFHPWWSLKEVEEKAATLRDYARDFQDAPDEQFERRVNSWLSEFGLSHMAFFHVSGRQVPAQLSIGAQLRAFPNGNGYGWYVQHLMQGGVAEQSGIRLGDAVLSVDGRRLSPPEEPKFQLGRTHQIVLQSNGDASCKAVKLALPSSTEKDRPPMSMPKPISDEVLPGNIGLVRVATFPGAVGFDFARSFDQTVAKLKAAGCNRLIVDLRGNPGGGLGSLRVMSYLVPDRRPTGYSLTRKGRASGRSMNTVTPISRIPGQKLGLWMMALRFGLLHRDRSLGLWTESFGIQPFHGKTVLLVDEFTRSAAEMIAAFASKSKVATLVGSQTPGQVLGAANFKLPGDYRLRIPLTAWYMWDDKMIEGKGVMPDVLVKPTLETLRNGIDEQMERALETARTL